MKSPVFWDITPRSPLKVNGRFGGTYRLQLHVPKNKTEQETSVKAGTKQNLTLVPCLGYSWNLTTEEICSSETSVDFQRTTRRYIPEDRTQYKKNTWYSGSI
jgi:hypothetical protein